MSMTQNQIKQIQENKIIDLINAKINTSLPCIVKEYDAETNRVKIKPFGGFLVNGEYVEYPEINNVPVISFQSNDGKAGISQSYKEDDLGLVIFVKNSFQEFLKKFSGDETDDKSDFVYPPFRYSDCVFMGGLYPTREEQADLSENAMTIYNEKMKIEVYPQYIKVVSRDNEDNGIVVNDNGIKANIGNNFVNINQSGIIGSVNGNQFNYNGDRFYIKGNLSVEGNISLSGTVDGVDVSSHQHIWRLNGQSNLTSSPVRG